MREGDEPKHFSLFPKQNLIITYYIISLFWFHIMDGLVHYVIRPGVIEKVMVMENNLMTFGCTYTKHRLKSNPGIVYTLTYLIGMATNTYSGTA